MAMNWVGLRAQEVLNEYIESNLKAKEQRQIEYNATIKIQVATRRFLVKQLIKKWRKSAKEIQRFYRGHLGREYFHECRRKRDYELRMAYFNYHALYVQRCFRGYWSRKYICDYYARKAFIAACVLAGKRMRTLCTMNYKLEVSEEQKEAKRKLDEEINKFFSENHHRCSTEVVKGAFYSPYVAIFGGGRSYLEERIRDARREEITGMELDKLKGLTEDGIPIKQAQNAFFVKSSKALHSRMSIDTRRRMKEVSKKSKTVGTLITLAGPFESRYDHRRKQEKWSSLLDISDKRFDVISKAKKAWWVNKGRGIGNAEPYHLRETLAKAAAVQELIDYPVMKESRWTTVVASGLLFDMYKPYSKVFPRVTQEYHSHHHWPKYSLSRSIQGDLLPPTHT
ncbi:hypothetical protein M758_12G170100 [Ceratodon purpureus]|uniref:Uncharacterized protein n=1 Tax=Ceratodon purpureus TaxID=3225 RepID=A0A8T0G7Z5_CERPU|nr:hypothetical protein KC19_12G168200 [Ceratodon purpureus]KAG0555426.1 hypothetical protein KC19_12G168200 [Ceratodon purpureus]KAG0599668.1 hypothetical protein M758_12G170100 [Ceratodon purpureus]